MEKHAATQWHEKENEFEEDFRQHRSELTRKTEKDFGDSSSDEINHERGQDTADKSTGLMFGLKNPVIKSSAVVRKEDILQNVALDPSQGGNFFQLKPQR
eukprot:CAMPEP_0168613506 /NCGR_PEP_ID=MMETSP0449_2-20121227/3487_1 /TAXON_ID=1082188 /ORGANISM="Strombidium rassoulzadegani, Strain ras09" /LENGTH=99 /DNA_ID=CAMNT_0008654143 /DNA_START=92 /DNA_END=391 /DNA_ORIENTATION=-